MKYVAAFDGLRGVAVLSVMFFHWKLPGCSGGYIGVDVFFVLSGYLITSILLAELLTGGDISLKRFYTRRILRLFPALSAMILLYLSLLPFAADKMQRLQDAFFVITYISDFTMAYLGRPKLLVHTWSLSIEEQFYLAWPAVLLILYKARHRFGLAFPVAMLAMLFTANRMFIADPSRIYYSLDTRVDAILYGCLAAVCLYGKEIKLPSFLPVAGWVVLFAYFAAPDLRSSLALNGYLVVSLSSVAVIVSAAGAGYDSRLLAAPPLVWVGKRAYGFYLWHYPLMGLFHSDVSGWRIVPAVSLTIAVTEISYRFIELPFLRLKDRQVPATTPSTRPSPDPMPT